MNIRKKVIIILAVILIVLTAVYFGYSSKEVSIIPDNVIINSAPEQSEAQPHPEFYVEEYVSIVPEGKNIALDAKMSSNGFQDVYTPMKVKDGDPEGTSYWEGQANSYPNILTAQLNELSSIHAIRLRLSPASVWGKREQEIEILISSDGENYTTLVPVERYTFDPDRGNEVIITFEETQTEFIQIIFTDNTGATGGQIAELEIYSIE